MEVALRKESVDRNHSSATSMRCCAVALRKESVDRNSLQTGDKEKGQVALRKESVDRNTALPGAIHRMKSSLSARRAWIEIHKPCG